MDQSEEGSVACFCVGTKIVVDDFFISTVGLQVCQTCVDHVQQFRVRVFCDRDSVRAACFFFGSQFQCDALAFDGIGHNRVIFECRNGIAGDDVLVHVG
ncbi:hypothetical protein SDC9_105242 [bioreactor metagenome]|uniref:Uncharacterized protein n=1 Tax=bioreactor metagenome TaxID=1076179 RepID=A0A645B1G9_9ZZZZ